MIRSVARLAVANPVASNLLMLAIFACGFVVYDSMPREVLPKFALQKIEVTTFYPGASAEDVERLVTGPLEEAIDGLRGIDEMVSDSREGLSLIQLTLEEGEDADDMVEDVRGAVLRGDVELPDEVDDPSLRSIEEQFPVISLFVYGWASEDVLRNEVERHQRGIEAIDGVSRVVATGDRDPRIWIEAEPLALERYGLTLEDIGRAVGAKAKDTPLGSLTTRGGESLLRIDAELSWAEDLETLPIVAQPNGTVVRLADVAVIMDTFERPVTRARFNGEPCLHLQVEKTEEGDMIDIAETVREYVLAQREFCPEGTDIGWNADVSIYVKNRLQVMKESGGLGAGLVLFALLLFLSFRVAFLTALGIPIAFMGGIMLAGVVGVSMNMVTMFALIVVLGMVVDDAIVVGENVYRLMEEGMSPARAAVEGTAQVGWPVVATILTSIAAFLPVIMLGGQVGNFMRPLPYVVSFCLLVSLFEAVTILPAHLAHLSGLSARSASGVGTGPPKRWYTPMQNGYTRCLAFVLRWRWVTIATAIAGAALVGTVGRYWIPFVFFDDFESKIFYLNLRLEPGASLEETERVTREIEAIVMETPESELESVNTLIGVSAATSSNYTLAENLSQVWIELREGPTRTMSSAAVIEDIRARIGELPSEVVAMEIDQPQAGPTGRAIEVAVRGPDLAVLAEISEELQTAVESYAGTREVHDNLDEGKREVRVILDDRGRTLGFTEAGLGAELRASFEGSTFGRVRRGRDDVELVVKLPEAIRTERSALERLRIGTPGGGRVPLGSIATLVDGRGPSVITHDGRERAVRIIADVDKEVGNSQTIVESLAERYADVGERYPGYSLTFQGDYEETAKAFADLGKAGVVALALIYLILGTLFRSFSQPFVIMFIIPFGATGMIAGHLLMDRSITLMSLIGLLALTGVVVNDSLILVDCTNQLRREGKSLFPAIVEAGRRRFRPILLTSMTTMLGLSPLTFFATGQARFLQPMAISIFFGLAIATVLVLVVVPCSYAVLEDIFAWVVRPRQSLARMRRRQPIHA